MKKYVKPIAEAITIDVETAILTTSPSESGNVGGNLPPGQDLD